MQCLLCQKKLGLLIRLKNGRFCCKEHHDQYQKKHQSHAFETLLERVRDAPLISHVRQPIKTSDEHEQTSVAADRSVVPDLSTEELLDPSATTLIDDVLDSEPAAIFTVSPRGETVATKATWAAGEEAAIKTGTEPEPEVAASHSLTLQAETGDEATLIEETAEVEEPTAIRDPAVVAETARSTQSAENTEQIPIDAADDTPPPMVASTSRDTDEVSSTGPAEPDAVSGAVNREDKYRMMTVPAPEEQEEKVPVMEQEDSDPVPTADPDRPLGAESAEGMAQFLATLDFDRHYYQEILDRVPVGIAILTNELEVRYSNQTFRELRSSNGTIRATDGEFRKSILSLMERLREGDQDQADDEMESEANGIRLLQQVSAVKLPLRDDRNPEALVVVQNPTEKGHEAA